MVRVRPVPTLGPGECYASLANGRFERRQLGQYRAENPDEAGAPPDAVDGLPVAGVGEPEAASVASMGPIEPGGVKS